MFLFNKTDKDIYVQRGGEKFLIPSKKSVMVDDADLAWQWVFSLQMRKGSRVIDALEVRTSIEDFSGIKYRFKPPEVVLDEPPPLENAPTGIVQEPEEIKQKRKLARLKSLPSDVIQQMALSNGCYDPSLTRHQLINVLLSKGIGVP